MARLILSTNNIAFENLLTVRKPDSELSESELSEALRYKLRDTQDNFSYLKYLDDKAGGIQAQPQVPGLALEYLSGYYIPRVDLSALPLSEERSQYEITVKIFYLSRADMRNKEYANDAVRFVMRKLDIDYIDLLIVSFPKRLSDGEIEKEDLSEEEIEENVATWTALSLLQERGIVNKLGVADFNTSKLDKFLKRVKVSPKVNQLNVKKCCNVAPSMIELAKLKKIELLTHNDSINILPNFSLSGILKLDGEDADLRTHGNQSSDNVKNLLSSKWVVKYTAVVRDRGVIEYKGYFAAIELLKSC
ncbi:putative glutamate--cysteine ligase regulatory subunit [Erysiphe neolycopersici]|uniref:GCS light chain n=1 Tax=Erysiphe neolycopersici TaxID=212602 RepID=A0A420HVV7_9PEZI|nr:putative glutamate--cysteine ligase regulatory subunit [Erysiphe neolycopersici]